MPFNNRYGAIWLGAFRPWYDPTFKWVTSANDIEWFNWGSTSYPRADPIYDKIYLSSGYWYDLKNTSNPTYKYMCQTDTRSKHIMTKISCFLINKLCCTVL